LNSGYPGFGCPGVVFLLLNFHFITKFLCLLNSALILFC